MTDLFAHDDHQRLTGFYAALISHCEAEIAQMRTGFQFELRRIKSPDAQAAYLGNYTADDCCSRPCNGPLIGKACMPERLPPNGKAYASDDFIRVVTNSSALCETEIGAVSLVPDHQKSETL